MRKSTFSSLLAVIGLMLSVTAPAGDQDRIRELSRTGAIVPLEQITAKVRKRNITHILEVELESEHDKLYYEVEALDDAGVVHKLKYDAVTGELIDERQKK